MNRTNTTFSALTAKLVEKRLFTPIGVFLFFLEISTIMLVMVHCYKLYQKRVVFKKSHQYANEVMLFIIALFHQLFSIHLVILVISLLARGNSVIVQVLAVGRILEAFKSFLTSYLQIFLPLLISFQLLQRSVIKLKEKRYHPYVTRKIRSITLFIIIFFSYIIQSYYEKCLLCQAVCITIGAPRGIISSYIVLITSFLLYLMALISAISYYHKVNKNQEIDKVTEKWFLFQPFAITLYGLSKSTAAIYIIICNYIKSKFLVEYAETLLCDHHGFLGIIIPVTFIISKTGFGMWMFNVQKVRVEPQVSFMEPEVVEEREIQEDNGDIGGIGVIYQAHY